jgi:hypothetical protein
MTDFNPWGVAFAQLTSRGPAPGRRQHFNPRPAGVVRAGSPTHHVWTHLAECPERWFSAQEVRRITGFSHAASSHALLYLVRMELLETAVDARNPRYLRYKVARGASMRVSSNSDEACAQRVESHAQTLPVAEQRRLAPVRGSWNQDLPAVDGVRAVPERHGASTNPSALAWAQRRGGPLHPRQLHLDRPRQSAEAPAVLRSNPAEGWSNTDSIGGCADTGDAGVCSDSEPAGTRVQSGAATAQAPISEIEVGYVAGRDSSASSVGRAPGVDTSGAGQPDRPNAAGEGDDTASHAHSSGDRLGRRAIAIESLGGSSESQREMLAPSHCERHATGTSHDAGASTARTQETSVRASNTPRL